MSQTSFIDILNEDILRNLFSCASKRMGKIDRVKCYKSLNVVVGDLSAELTAIMENPAVAFMTILSLRRQGSLREKDLLNMIYTKIGEEVDINPSDFKRKVRVLLDLLKKSDIVKTANLGGEEYLTLNDQSFVVRFFGDSIHLLFVSGIKSPFLEPWLIKYVLDDLDNASKVMVSKLVRNESFELFKPSKLYRSLSRLDVDVSRIVRILSDILYGSHNLLGKKENEILLAQVMAVIKNNLNKKEYERYRRRYEMIPREISFGKDFVFSERNVSNYLREIGIYICGCKWYTFKPYFGVKDTFWKHLYNLSKKYNLLSAKKRKKEVVLTYALMQAIVQLENVEVDLFKIKRENYLVNRIVMGVRELIGVLEKTFMFRASEYRHILVHRALNLIRDELVLMCIKSKIFPINYSIVNVIDSIDIENLKNLLTMIMRSLIRTWDSQHEYMILRMKDSKRHRDNIDHGLQFSPLVLNEVKNKSRKMPMLYELLYGCKKRDYGKEDRRGHRGDCKGIFGYQELSNRIKNISSKVSKGVFSGVSIRDSEVDFISYVALSFYFAVTDVGSLWKFVRDNLKLYCDLCEKKVSVDELNRYLSADFYSSTKGNV